MWTKFPLKKLQSIHSSIEMNAMNFKHSMLSSLTGKFVIQKFKYQQQILAQVLLKQIFALINMHTFSAPHSRKHTQREIISGKFVSLLHRHSPERKERTWMGKFMFRLCYEISTNAEFTTTQTFHSKQLQVQS